jgi:hypothetical protein
MSEQDSVESFIWKLNRAMDYLAESGMPVSHINMGLEARRLWRQWFHGQSERTVELEDGTMHHLSALRHRGVVVSSEVADIVPRGDGVAVIPGGDDPWLCFLGVSQARPLPPRWLELDTPIVHMDDPNDRRTVVQIDTRKGIVTTEPPATIPFHELREKWKPDWPIEVKRGQLWLELGIGAYWRIVDVVGDTVHMHWEEARVERLSNLLGTSGSPRYLLVSDVPRGTKPLPLPGPVREPKPKDAPKVRVLAPVTADDLISGDDDLI